MSGSEDKTELLKEIKEEILAAKKSPLYAERKKNKVFPVIGEGSHRAKIMFIGEAPGKNEAATGRPFCGASGRVLDKLLAHIGMNRKNVYITNLVKDRPPGNRDPYPEEVAFYAPFLERQIEIIRPQIIAPLGRHSMGYIMEKFGLASKIQNISRLHGKVFEAKAPYGKIKVVPLFHPAVGVYDASRIPELEKDFEVFKKIK